MCTNLHRLNCIRHRSRQCLRQPSIQETSTTNTGDVNYQHTDCGYKQTTKDRDTLSGWASSAEAVILYDRKERPASSLHVGTHTLNRTWHSLWASAAAKSQNDTPLVDFPGHIIGRLSSKCHRWLSR